MNQGFLDEYRRLQEEMDAVHEGRYLRSVADAVLNQLPSGPLCLVSTSMAGTAVAAAVASLRDHQTRWTRVTLTSNRRLETLGTPIVVEVVDAGSAWRTAIRRRFPGARIIVVSEIPGVETKLSA